MSDREGSSRGGKFGVLGVLLNYGLARIAPASSTRRLVRRLSSPNEETAMAAYMALVKLGPGVRPSLVDVAGRGQHTADILQIIADQGDPTAIADVEEFLDSQDPKVAETARESIRTLRQAGND